MDERIIRLPFRSLRSSVSAAAEVAGLGVGAGKLIVRFFRGWMYLDGLRQVRDGLCILIRVELDAGHAEQRLKILRINFQSAAELGLRRFRLPLGKQRCARLL